MFRSGSANPMANEKISMLEQKVFKLQEELTEMHRRKGEVSNAIYLITDNQSCF